MAKKINKKRLLIHSLVFSPDGVSTAYLYNDIALGFQKKKYEVIVLTTTPHYNQIQNSLDRQPLKKRFLGLFFTSNFNGIKVYHIPLKKYKNSLVRILSFFYWHCTSLIIGLFLKKPNIILTPSPPLSSGLISILLAKIKGSKCVYNVQEIYPDLLINHGRLTNKLIINFLKILEGCVYNWSNVVTTIDISFYKTIKTRIRNHNKLKIISNFVDTDLYKTSSSNPLPKVFKKIKGKTNMVYAGNIGIAQEWDLVVNLAKVIKKYPITIWIIGEGVKKKYLESQIKNHNLTNIHLLPYQERKYMPEINLFADFHFIAMNKNMENDGFPSKVYTIMSSGKPMVVVSSKQTPIVSFLEETKAALTVTNHSLRDFRKAVLKLTTDKNLRDKLGLNGRKIVEQNYNKQVVIEKYLKLAENI
ncbi:MAG: glycosyltransferase family 4 protein [Flammeovirgaceae bacterium]